MALKNYLCKDYPDILGLRLDKALSFFEEIGTRSRAENLLQQSRVTVNKKTEKNSYKIMGHEEISVDFPEAVVTELTPYEFPLDILFEDQDLIILNKPAGLVVHPGAGHQDKTLVNALIAHTSDLSMKFNENRPGIVHRIDKETSGLLVIAKNDFIHEALSNQFKEKTVHRIYEAVCWGQHKPPQGTVQSFLARHPNDRQRFSSVRNAKNQIIRDQIEGSEIGKWAVTHYKVLNFNKGFSLVQFQLETGRTHQIRVHTSEMGHPLVGDNTYGANKRNLELKDVFLKNQFANLKRFYLHAAELGIVHPRSQEKLFFKVDWPKEDLDLIAAWGLK